MITFFQVPYGSVPWRKLIIDACNKSKFCFNKKIYKQTNGVFMGSPLGPVSGKPSGWPLRFYPHHLLVLGDHIKLQKFVDLPIQKKKG